VIHGRRLRRESSNCDVRSKDLTSQNDLTQLEIKNDLVSTTMNINKQKTRFPTGFLL
jgi:hypothetical protein